MTAVTPERDVHHLIAGADTKPVALASAITVTLRQHGYAILDAIGSEAVHVSVKASTFAREYLAKEGLDLVMTPDLFHKDNKNHPGTPIAVTRWRITRIPLE